MNYREITRKLMALGCDELPRRGGGSHRKWFNPITQRVTSLPDWGSRDLKPGTIRAAMRQLGIEWKAFENLSKKQPMDEAKGTNPPCKSPPE
ncbi:MAG: Predicted RNA binding protein YcfA, dsRBD-like fold, HicA-like mRNA interferase family [Candidatus Kentron sp. G]|nr:MAG: Predicted RNA binding protein YcfA, dsRBD-like fold, HicA-like mRNA interferase family [Candidatus Kentron sp. G]VFM96600.1 MAG: Predicted RNA binding protein YcfA, dsRBD-like fold, HicA-like mRNA interferase family [Candidatus Kentron sp. G]